MRVRRNRPGSEGTGSLAAREFARRAEVLSTGARGRLAAVSCVAFVAGILEAGVLVLIARLAVGVAADERFSLVVPVIETDLDVGEALIVALALLVLRTIAGGFTARMTASFATRVLGDTRLSLLASFERASWQVQSSEQLGALQDLMTTHADRTAGATMALATAITATLNLLTLLVVAVVVNPFAAAGVAAAGVLLSAGLRPIAAAARANATEQVEAGRSFAERVTEFVALARDIRTFGVGSRVLTELETRHHRQARHYRRSRFLTLLTPHLYQGAALAVLVGTIAALRELEPSGLEEVGAVVLLLLRALAYGQQVQSNQQVLNDSAPYLDALIAERDRYRGSAVERGGAAADSIGDLVFEHVTFAYDDGDPVIRDLTLTIAKGETIGVVGPSGSGKSTLMQLCLRLRTPVHGAIRNDGTDVRELALADWYRLVAFVPQQPDLVHATVADNIRFWRDIDDTEIEHAARLAHIDDDIRALPDGYATVVGPGGRALSGGQRQRLCIARALASNPDLLLLDEPTSALDAPSERAIQETLCSLAGSLTMVIVAHRLTTLSVCDRILVLADGVAQGYAPHDELLRTSAFYATALRQSVLDAGDLA